MVLDFLSGDYFHFMNVDGKVECRCVPEIKSNHKEADTKIVRHAIEADQLTRSP